MHNYVTWTVGAYIFLTKTLKQIHQTVKDVPKFSQFTLKLPLYSNNPAPPYVPSNEISLMFVSHCDNNITNITVLAILDTFMASCNSLEFEAIHIKGTVAKYGDRRVLYANLYVVDD